MAVPSSDGSIILSTKVDTSGMIKGISSIKGMVSRIGGMLAAVFGVRALINFSKEAVNLASDLQEVQNVVDVAFGDMAYKAEEFAKSAIENFGISELSAKRTASTYMAMGKGMGIAEEAAADMAITMTGLTADIASFHNMSQERADVILKSVYTGETETLKQLGIVMTEVNLENFAMTKGITKKLSAMTQEEKTMLRYQFVLEQTKLAQGDFVRTRDSWANQTRTLSERWKEMYTIFGEAFMMIGTLVLPAINSLVSGLTTVANIAKTAAANVYELFTGKKWDKASEAVSSTTEEQEALTAETEKTAKAQKKLLAGFDEIEILSSKASEGTSKGTDNSSATVLPDVGNETKESGSTDTGKYQEIASAIKSTLADILDAASKALLAVGLIVFFTGNPIGGISLIMAGAAAYVAGDTLRSDSPLETLKGHLATLEKFLVPALLGLGVMMLFSGVIPLGIGLILAGAAYWGYKEVQSQEYDTATFQDKLNVIMEAVSLALIAIGVILMFFGHLPLGIGIIIAGRELLGATEAKLKEGEVTTKIQNFFKENEQLIVGVGLALVIIALIMLACGNISKISLGLLVAGGAVLAAAEEMQPGVIKETITKFFKDNAGLIVGVSIALIVIGIILLITGVGIPLGIGMIIAGGGALAAEVALNWDTIKETVSTKISEIHDFIKSHGFAMMVLGLILILTGIAAPIGFGLLAIGVQGMAEGKDPIWNNIVDKLKETWNSIKDYWNENIADVFTVNFWLQLAKKAANGLIEGFELGINGIISMFEDMINWIIDGINSISFDLPDILGGGHIGFNIPNVKFGRVAIPRLAQGAVIPPNREFLAVLGDQKHGTNIEAPLQTIVEAFNIALAQNGNVGGGNTEVVLELDGRELGRAIVEQGNRENRRIGTRLVIV